jgi:hypothetical protein
MARNYHHKTPALNRASAALAKLKPGAYSVDDIYKFLLEQKTITFGTAWSRIRGWLQDAPDWHWNGIKVPAKKSRWVKEAPAPVVVPKPVTQPIVVVQTKPEIEEPHKGSVYTSLQHIDAIMEAICLAWDIKVDRPLPTVEPVYIYMEALAALKLQLLAVKSCGNYLRASKLDAMLKIINDALAH